MCMCVYYYHKGPITNFSEPYIFIDSGASNQSCMGINTSSISSIASDDKLVPAVVIIGIPVDNDPELDIAAVAVVPALGCPGF